MESEEICVRHHGYDENDLIISAYNEELLQEIDDANEIRICPCCGMANDFQHVAIKPRLRTFPIVDIQCLACGNVSTGDNWGAEYGL